MSEQNKIPCAVAQDLMPLVIDGAASEQSRQAVAQHVAACSACSQIYREMQSAAPAPVAQGKADVCICEPSSAGLYAEANGGLATTDFRFEVDPNMNGTCVAMPTDGTESLCDVVNECIQELNASGQIEAWYAQYEAAAKALGVE